MRRVDHPDVVRERIVVRVHLPGPIKRVLVVETKMTCDAQEDSFDKGKYNALVQAVQTAALRVGADEAEIVQV